MFHCSQRIALPVLFFGNIQGNLCDTSPSEVTETDNSLYGGRGGDFKSVFETITSFITHCGK